MQPEIKIHGARPCDALATGNVTGCLFDGPFGFLVHEGGGGIEDEA
jgi:hypothetical protein